MSVNLIGAGSIARILDKGPVAEKVSEIRYLSGSCVLSTSVINVGLIKGSIASIRSKVVLASIPLRPESSKWLRAVGSHGSGLLTFSSDGNSGHTSRVVNSDADF